MPIIAGWRRFSARKDDGYLEEDIVPKRIFEELIPFLKHETEVNRFIKADFGPQFNYPATNLSKDSRQTRRDSTLISGPRPPRHNI